MTHAVSLALVAAVLHATWNLAAKRVEGGTAFIWLTSALVMVCYAPAVVWVYFSQRPQLGLAAWVFILGSGLLHIAYFQVLLRGYREADLSVVYPMARGSGPLLSSTGAILMLGERPTWVGGAGMLLVVGGVFLLAKGGSTQNQNPERRHRGWWYGLLTGAFIAAYTLWDKYAVSQLYIPPIWLDYGSPATRVILLAPFAWQQRTEVARHWEVHRMECLVVALISPLAYILVLVAMQHAPVSVVAPAREASIFFGVLFGAKLLAERQVKMRLFASVLIFVGIAALAMG